MNPKRRTLLVLPNVEANNRTCGPCIYLQKRYERPEEVRTYLEWWCSLFHESRGLIGAQKTPNRSNLCLKAESKARYWEHITRGGIYEHPDELGR